jgi:hypothetical protein
MMLRATSLWMLRRLSVQPMAWIGAGVAMAVWPLVIVFSPISLTMTPADLSVLAGQAGWLGALGAALLAMGPLAESAWILDQARPARAAWARISALLVAASIGFVVAIAGAGLFGSDLELPWGTLLGSGALSVTHIVALAWVCLGLRVPESTRSLCLLLSAWVLPSLAGGGLGPLSRLAAALDTQHAAGLLSDSTLSGIARELLPIVLVVLAALLSGPLGARSPASPR